MTFGPFRCLNCGERFIFKMELRQHKRAVHNPNSQFGKGERPIDRGPVPCGIGECPATFANERNAEQHRKHKHGVQND